MVQVRIEIDYNVDLGNAELIAGSFNARVVLNTARGERHALYDFNGSGDIDKAREIVLDWVRDNMLEYDNPSCRPLRYLKVAEQ